jgi:hypothetical protein
MSRFQRRSSNSVPRCIVQRLSRMTRSWTARDACKRIDAACRAHAQT